MVMKNIGRNSLSMNRRAFIRGASLVAATTGLAISRPIFALPGETRKHPRPIAQMELDLNHIHKWDDSNGDTWDPFWADDDGLYSFNCDGRGFGKAPKNLAFNRFEGSSIEELQGFQVNSMDGYGPANQHGPDNATWKACGQECIDGIFYAFVARNVYGNESHDPLMRQTAFNASLIKSEDRGRTWVRSAVDNYARPMWPGPSFGAPFFVHYGKNGGSLSIDRSNEFVYAVSTNGFWNDGDSLILGRVPRLELPKLDASCWVYFQGGNGLSNGAWSAQISDAQPILGSPARCGQGPITYIPALGAYLLISWYNPRPLRKWYQPDEMKYDFYQAEHPWGPWALLSSFSDRFLAAGSNMYGPALCPKFQKAEGDGTRVILFTSGCQFEDKPTGIYKAWCIPVLLHSTLLPSARSIRYNDPKITRKGDWSELTSAANRSDDVLTGNAADASISLLFKGSGIEYIARKAAGFGDVEIVVDNRQPTTISLGIKNFPALSGVSVFEALNLSGKMHSVKLRSLGNGPINLQSLNIYK
jgi:hypothetical protein